MEHPLADELAGCAAQGFDTTDYTTQIAGEIKNFSGAGYIDRKAERRLDAVIKYAMVAGKKVSSLKSSNAFTTRRGFMYLSY